MSLKSQKTFRDAGCCSDTKNVQIVKVKVNVDLYSASSWTHL